MKQIIKNLFTKKDSKFRQCFKWDFKNDIQSNKEKSSSDDHTVFYRQLAVIVFKKVHNNDVA